MENGKCGPMLGLTAWLASVGNFELLCWLLGPQETFVIKKALS